MGARCLLAPERNDEGGAVLKRLLEIITLKRLWDRRQAQRGRRR